LILNLEEDVLKLKGQGGGVGFIWITPTIVRNLGKNIANYYIYIVYEIKNKPKLKILEPDAIFKNLKIDPLFLLTGAVINEYGKNIKI
jgi:hypothetical protein